MRTIWFKSCERKKVNSWYFLLRLYINRNVSIGQDVCFFKFKYRDKKTAERADFFTLTRHMLFARVTYHNVIKCLPSIRLCLRSTMVWTFSSMLCMLLFKIREQQDNIFHVWKCDERKTEMQSWRTGLINRVMFSRTISWLREEVYVDRWPGFQPQPHSVLPEPPPACYLPSKSLFYDV